MLIEKNQVALFYYTVRDEQGNVVENSHPGGAGSRRFTLPITVERLEVSEDGVAGEIIELSV